MLARTLVCRAVSPYAIFMKQSYTQFAKLPTFAARGKAMGKAYRALPAADKKALIAKAKVTKPFKRNVKANKLRAQKRTLRRVALKLSKATEKKVTIASYRAFIKKNPKATLLALTKKWKLAHPAKKAAKK